MRILIVAATPFEIAPLIQHLEQEPFQQVQPSLFRKGGHEVQLLVTGVGIALTTYHLTRVLAKQSFDLVLNGGIAGSFRRSLKMGAVVQVQSEQFGDLGVEEADGSFTDIFSMGLLDPNFSPFEQGKLIQPLTEPIPGLQSVSGLTVHRVHGYPASIEACIRRYEVDIETMESAAVFMCCLLSAAPFLAIRSISNYVEARNREAWDIPLAIDQLNQTLITMIDSILE
ncbi:MAG: futalosine hydrolase [Saprospirales bacterium]|nr:futalosine hydrolase [Saprospirales bacterium]MBK8490196.1 futalosine hydrolase [Saprospirales bacterium]